MQVVQRPEGAARRGAAVMKSSIGRKVPCQAVKLVLWDIDGTLVHTAGFGRDAFGDAFAAVFGRQVEAFDLPMAGRTDHAITVALLEAEGETDGEGHVQRVLDALGPALEALRERIAEEGHATPGAAQTLRAVAERPGVTQSLLTGNIEVNAALKLAAFGLDGLVDLEIGGYGSDPHSSRSDLVGVAREKAARLRGTAVDVADTILVGDTPLDVDAALSAGARAIGVAAGPYGVGELIEAGAESAFEDLRDADGLIAALGV